MSKHSEKLIEAIAIKAARNGDYETSGPTTRDACDAARKKLTTYVEKLESYVVKLEAATELVRDAENSDYRLLRDFIGDLIELDIRYGCGSVSIVGWVRLVEGGSNTYLWIGDARVPDDALIRHKIGGDAWVFEAHKYVKADAEREGIHPDVVKAIEACADAAVEADKVSRGLTVGMTGLYYPKSQARPAFIDPAEVIEERR